MHEVEVRAHRVASATEGLATRRQLVDGGVADSTVRRRVRAGVWTRPAPSVIDVTGAPWTWRRRVHAAVLYGGPGTVASHATAAGLQGWPGWERDGPVEVTVPRRRRSLHDLDVVVHSTTNPLPPVPADGVMTCRPMRVLIDLSGRCRDADLARAARELLRRGLVAAPDLDPARWNGLPVRRALLAVHTEIAAERFAVESPLEADVVDVLARSDLPPCTLQHEVRIRGVRLRIDIAWPEHRAALEVDGARWHADTLRRQADAARAEWLEAAGWRVHRCGAADLVDPYRRTLLLRRLRRTLGG